MTDMKQYLGDSVYADFDGYGILLYTENGFGPKNQIALEPFVLDALNRYVEWVKQKMSQEGVKS